MEPATYPVVSAGVDYLTVTGCSLHGSSELHSQASALFQNQGDRGSIPKPWGLAGFKGWSCGGVQIGVRDDDVCVRLSSEVAQRSWRKIYQLAGNCSRIDLQLTVEVPGGPTQLIDDVREEARRFATTRRNKPIVRWTQDHTGGYTLYLGSRSSNAFGRVYDKFQESKIGYFRDCVRFEVQYQNELAKMVGARMVAEPSEVPGITSHCRQFFWDRGVEPRWYYTAGARLSCSRMRGDVEKNLEWLATAVGPCIRRLIDLGHGEATLRALGLIEDDTSYVDHVANTLTERLN